ncbi:oligoendopeptidase F [Salinirubellus salinus]|uniref:Oligoendopeptidase F n=1 Tax=Salinirubellus salinus TaxID=1364945 RepID=A0A9E7U9A1_9EURY|nr:oligoendopeptidase F [Salinirubellus salinus]UWM53058.1 oligoendopeptidase F [Salinirubellus salinus]
MSTVPDRSELDEEYKWDLESMYADDEAWEDAYERVEDRLDDLRAYEGRVTESADTLLELLELREELMREVSNVSAYARMRSDEDTANQQYQALSARAQSLGSQASSAASFVEPELQQSTRSALHAFVDEEPELERYEHYFDDVLRMKPHTRSPEVEELLADLSEVTGAGGDVYNMLTNADMTFPAIETPAGEEKRITLSNFTVIQKHGDRDYRQRAYEAFYDEWADYRNAIGTAFKNSVRKDVKMARARNYDTAREASLDGPNVPTEVYDNLVEAVHEHLSVLHRHADLKRDRLGVDELKMWDLYAPLTDSKAPDIEYEQAKAWVVEAVEPLGEAYQSRMAEGLESRWVDVYETENKRSGAYSSGTYDSQPFILMNYQDDVTSLYTLAHELGHSMHSELTSEHQPYVYSGYEIFTAEVASTVNEALLTNHLLETVEDETLRRHVLDEYLERFRSTLFRQTMFADFEQQVHELSEAGEAITPDVCDEVYGDLKAEFYAPADVDERIAREWMRIPHFYYSFYVYQYATGISAANAIVQNIEAEGESAAEAYLEFLRSGSRAYPLELLRGAGVDMASSAPVEAAIDAYDDLLGEFEQLS